MLITKEQKPIPQAGTHTAILYSVVDLGTQEVNYQDTPTQQKRLVRLTWELSEQLMEDGRPFVVSRQYTVSLSPKSNLCRDLKSWTGEDPSETGKIDLEELLGKACNVTIVHNKAANGNTYANIASITPLKASEQAPEQVNPSVDFSLDAYKQTEFDKLPEWLQDIVKKSPEYQKLGKKPEPNIDPDMDDEIPF